MKKTLIGQKFNRLTVIKLSPERKNNRPNYICRCDCGNIITAIGSAVKSGNTTSCGCYQKEAARIAKTKHSGSYTPEYSTWQNMRRRCGDPTDKRYIRYGGRGISVCKRWDVFENFIKDMGLKPSPKHSIHRVNNDGNYTPSNCVWATPKEQSRVTSRNRYIFNGIDSVPAIDFEDKFSLYRGAVYYFREAGYSDDEILKMSQNGGIGKMKYEYGGEYDTLVGWANKYKINKESMYKQFRKTRSVEDVLLKYKKI